MTGMPQIGPVQAAQDPDLGQRLVLDPAMDVVQVGEVLTALGYTAQTTPGDGPPSWHKGAGRPFVTLTSNPVFRLHVLDVGTVPPMHRAELAAQLPILGLSDLEARLDTDSPADVLHAIWALVDREDVGCLEKLQRMAQSAPEPLASEAARGATRMAEIDADRQALMGGLALVAETAADVIDLLGDEQTAHSLLAGPEVCAALFTPDIAPLVAEWVVQQPHNIGNGMQGRLADKTSVVPAQAGLLRWHNRYSRAFPMGYRDAAGWLAPGTVWVTWKTETAPGQTMTYDGLVLAQGQWWLFPRPFRAVAQAVAAQSRAG